MNPIESAVQMFEEGYSCSQAMLCAFAPRYGLDRDLALKIASPFGGGIAKQGLSCGAMTGAILVLGLHGGRTDPDDVETREKNDALVREFMARYSKDNGATMCNDLTGVDISDAEARTAAQEAGVYAGICPNLVRYAAGLVLELIERP